MIIYHISSGSHTRNNIIRSSVRYMTSSPHGPAREFSHSYRKPAGSITSFDAVPYYSCSSWPPIAKAWIDRKHLCNWPSKETIQTIVSEGCRIVHKPHAMSQDKETVFRFSFSLAEIILFRTLPSNQKKCFVAFKSLIKYGVSKLENIKDEINLSSYCLKTIFLWTCETIPADHWQTKNGWARCLPYMIDQLYSCVKFGNLPGYFIPEMNLLDILKRPCELLDGIEQLRSSPLSYAATFINATKCFRGFYSVISLGEESNMFSRNTHETTENMLTGQLKFLHRIVAKSKATRCGLFWKEEIVLRMFANWCKQNACAICLAPWQCSTEDMTLFDIVYLDIVHEFDIPNNVLLKYLDRGYSAEFVCRLGSCYSFYRFDQEKPKKDVKYSFLFKTLLLTHHALNHEIVSVKTIFTCVSVLIKLEEFETAARVLECGTGEFVKSYESISFDYVFASVVGYKLRNNLREMADMNEREHETELFKMSVPVFFWYSLYVCYKNLGYREKLQGVLTKMNYCSKITSSRNLFSEMDYIDILLFLEMYENMQEWRMYHYEFYDTFISLEMFLIKQSANNFKIWGLDENDPDDPVFLRSLYSCNESIWASIPTFTGPCFPVGTGFSGDNAEVLIRRQIVTTADRVYYAQVMIVRKKFEQAISTLNAIVDTEGNYSRSVVIWPKPLWKSNFLNTKLRKEMIKSSDNYVVFPSYLYARYILTYAHPALGQTKENELNMDEFIKLLEWYSSFTAFAPMSNIMFNVFKK